MPKTHETDRAKARRRALRAAQVVTLGLALSGCYANHGAGRDARSVSPPPSVAVRAALPDEGPPPPPDAGMPAEPDLGLRALSDAGMTCSLENEDWSECCSELGWPCDEVNTWGCCAWGPFVPPEEGALPPSRADLLERAA